MRSVGTRPCGCATGAVRWYSLGLHCRDAHFVGNTTAANILFDFLSHNRTIVTADDREAKPDRADFELIFACGNWYDDRKAAMVHHLANAHLSAKILIAESDHFCGSSLPSDCASLVPSIRR